MMQSLTGCNYLNDSIDCTLNIVLPPAHINVHNFITAELAI
jgi:hypothetical protein